MEVYFVEGTFITPKGVKKTRKNGRVASSDLEPFARRIYANSEQEALQLAEEALNGGQWLEKPTVSKVTESQRMRQIGAPQLPGFETAPKKSAKKK